MPIFNHKSGPEAETRKAASITLQRATPRQMSPSAMDAGLTRMSTYHYARSPLQRRAIHAAATDIPESSHPDGPRTEGAYGTGLPVNLQSGIQALSGLSLDHVKVHYNSPEPGQMNALAYARGRNIYLAQGQEKHLPHEAWHVVQQAQGRVRPTLQMKSGVPVNNDRALEIEADVMGAKALAMESAAPRNSRRSPLSAAVPVVQGVFTKRNLDGVEEDAPPLEVLAAERHLHEAGIPRGRFREIRLSEERVNLADFMLEKAPARQEATTSTSSRGALENTVAEDPVTLIDTTQDQPSAIITPELIAAYRADLINESAQFLQEAEGNAIAQHLDVTAHVMNQVSGPLIQSNGIQYGNGENEGYLLHIHGNHYIVIAQTDGPDVEYIDTLGNGYAEITPTVADGNCLIDGLYIIRHGEHASAQDVGLLRAIADAGITDEDIGAAMSPILTDFAKGIHPSGLGVRTMGMIGRDPQLQGLHHQARAARAKARRKAWRKKSVPAKRPRKQSLEDAVTTYVLECNRLGEKAVRDSGRFEDLKELWSDTHDGEKLPDHESLIQWIAKREATEKEYYGSDTESDSSDDEKPRGDDDRMLAEAYEFTAEDEALLKGLNAEIRAAKTPKNIEAILRKKEYGRFVVPQYRGIAYMTNRFGKDKRLEHRKSSQLGLPVFADAARPEDMPREKFYTTEHALDSAPVVKAKEIKKWLAERRKPSPFIDSTRKIGGTGKKVNRVFPTAFHALQSDYSENYTKSAAIIAKYHAEAREEKRGSGEREEKGESSALKESAQNKTYKGIPFRSHPFVSTADEARHAVRYALGNKPIEAEKGFRLRPRWRKSGKPQHPYSGKVYTSLHPLRDYLSPDAPSHVWSGRKVGALAINNHISKEGESSFLALLKHDRVALEQVIRWPSLTKDKDDSGEFGLSRKSRKQYRRLLKTTAPHSQQQKDMKAKNLGPLMENFFVELIERRMRAEAVRYNQKLIYRGLDGNFQATPPTYVTPSKKTQNTWRELRSKEKQEEMFEKIRSGEIPYGGLTEGYSKDWPTEEVYEALSDDDYARDDDRDRNARVEALIERLGRIRDETVEALQHLRDNNLPAVSMGYRTAATGLARLAWRRIAAGALHFGIDEGVAVFPEEFAQEPMATGNEQALTAATEVHIDELVEALIALTSAVLRSYLNPENNDDAPMEENAGGSSSS